MRMTTNFALHCLFNAYDAVISPDSLWLIYHTPLGYNTSGSTIQRFAAKSVSVTIKKPACRKTEAR
jgi:hypothetical protein